MSWMRNELNGTEEKRKSDAERKKKKRERQKLH